ncbi:19852_t:CDS:2 [Cetraspora pellucida]|uniref:19852_t:CDS:1 n=1 Tax=Cetraspora pellucida TaxID=1433469 RepID=A0A9N9N925_9GLOM|nr:19852_t:CDS:2 [Cetraspora pellucida]
MDFELYFNYLKKENTNEVLNNQEILILVTNIESKKVLIEDDNSKEDKDDKSK